MSDGSDDTGLTVWLVEHAEMDEPGLFIGAFASRDLALLAATVHCQETRYCAPSEMRIWSELLRCDVPDVAIDAETLVAIDRANPETGR